MAARYAELETLAAHQADEDNIKQLVKLLEINSTSLIEACCQAIDHILLALAALKRRGMFKKDDGQQSLREAGAVRFALQSGCQKF